METSTLQKKKNSVQKGKLKKAIKNIVCRPDPLHWPIVKEDQENIILSELEKYKVAIPEFKKPHWKVLKLIPKDKRPKPPPIKKPEGFLFGRSECLECLERGECAAVILDAKINPRIIFQSILEACEIKNVPVVCLNDIRKHSLLYFGIPTSSLGFKCNSVPEVVKLIKEVTKHEEKTLAKSITSKNEKFEEKEINAEQEKEKSAVKLTVSPYIYRDTKKVRIFIPHSKDNSDKKSFNKFSGQDFIEFQEANDNRIQANYKPMLLKRISSNPNRLNGKVKKKKTSKIS